MTKVILHGGYTRVHNELNASFWQEVVKDIPDNGKVLLVYFAREDKIQERFEGDRAYLLEQNPGRALEVELASKDTFLAQLQAADAVYLAGGDTGHLFEILKGYPMFLTAIAGKTIAGSSAGAYVLSGWYYDDPKKSANAAFGLVPARVVCHYQTEAEDNREHAVNAFGAMNALVSDLPLVLLKDYEWEVFTV